MNKKEKKEELFEQALRDLQANATKEGLPYDEVLLDFAVSLAVQLKSYVLEEIVAIKKEVASNVQQ